MESGFAPAVWSDGAQCIIPRAGWGPGPALGAAELSSDQAGTTSLHL